MDELDVLVVDDHEHMRELLRRALLSAGAACVRTAATAAAALESLDERPAMLILADRNMPGMSGLDFIAAVRAEPRYGVPRIVMITGHEGQEHAAAARKAGADLVLVKPISPRELITALNGLMRA